MILKNTTALVACLFLLNSCGGEKSENEKEEKELRLDLVGGISIALEVPVPELIKSNVGNQRNPKFIEAFDEANKAYISGEEDFLELFVTAYRKASGDKSLNKLFSGSKFRGKNDDEIIQYFRDVLDNSIDRVELIMEKRINQLGVAHNIQKDVANNRIYIELPEIQDEATVSKKLKSTANLEFYELYAVSEIYDLLLDADRASREESLTADTTEEESLSLDMNVSSEKGILDYLEGEIKNDQSMAQTLGYVLPENKYAIDKLMSKSEVSSVISSAPFEVKFMWSAKPELVDQKKSIKAYFLYACKVPIDREPLVSGEDIAKASQGYDQTNGKITVDLEMSDEGADKWSQLTGSNINKLVAITMDNLVFSAPVVNGVLSKNSQISGSFTFEEAEDLTALLNGGALPVPLIIVEKKKVVRGSMGKDYTITSYSSKGELRRVEVYKDGKPVSCEGDCD